MAEVVGGHRQLRRFVAAAGAKWLYQQGRRGGGSCSIVKRRVNFTFPSVVFIYISEAVRTDSCKYVCMHVLR